MPGKAKYCEHCKGYGGLYVQTIKRYGDDRIKERTPIEEEACVSCTGTGMIHNTTDKKPVFDVVNTIEVPLPVDKLSKALTIEVEEEKVESSEKADVIPAEEIVTHIIEEETTKIDEDPDKESPDEDEKGLPWDDHPAVAPSEEEPESNEEDVVFEPTPIDDDSEMGL